MGGIAGIAYLDGRPAEPEAGRRMLEAMPHRMRGGVGLRALGSASFAQSLSASVPEDLSAEPPHVLSDCIIVADARIDNRMEIGSALGLTSEELAQMPEAMLLLRAYLKWGPACPERILGDFAFAVWNGRTRTLLCARDRFGARPMSVFRSDSFWAFASEPKGILALSDVPREINEERICYHFYPELLIGDKTITFYRGIDRLEPAHVAVASPDGKHMRRYWDLDPEAESDCADEAEYVERFRELFTQAVDARLRATGPVASTLSGGLDSSSIACTARDLLASRGLPRLHTYSAVFDEVPEADERQWISAVTDQGRIVHRDVHPDAVSPLIDLDTVLWLQDGPFYGTNYFIHWEIYRAAAEDGVVVLLDGEDGDTTVSHGIDMLFQLVQSEAWAEFAAECDAIVKGFDNEIYASRKGFVHEYALPYLSHLARTRKWIAFGRNMSRIHEQFGFSRRNMLVGYGLKKTPLAALAKRIIRPQRPPQIPPNNVLQEELLRAHDIPERIRELFDRYHSIEFPSGPRRNHVNRLRAGDIPYALETFDRMASYWGIELRHPFCDSRLAEYALSVPPELKLRNGMSRYIIREALTGTLPDLIRTRTGKGDLRGVSEHGFRTFERDAVASIAGCDDSFGGGYIRADRVRAVAEHAIDGPNVDVPFELWQALILDRWLKTREAIQSPTSSD